MTGKYGSFFLILKCGSFDGTKGLLVIGSRKPDSFGLPALLPFPGKRFLHNDKPCRSRASRLEAQVRHLVLGIGGTLGRGLFVCL